MPMSRKTRSGSNAFDFVLDRRVRIVERASLRGRAAPASSPACRRRRGCRRRSASDAAANATATCAASVAGAGAAAPRVATSRSGRCDDERAAVAGPVAFARESCRRASRRAAAPASGRCRGRRARARPRCRPARTARRLSSICSGVRPMPGSRTLTRDERRRRRCATSSMRPPASEYFAALLSRFENTCARRS